MIKRVLLVMSITLCVLCFFGCSSKSKVRNVTLTQDDKWIVEQVLSATSESEAIFSDLSELIGNQIKESAAYTKGYEKATKEGQLYDAESYEQLIRTNKTKTAELINQCKSTTQRLERLGISPNSNVRAVQDAAKEYFGNLYDSIDTLDALLQFYVDIADANAPLADINSNASSSDMFTYMQEFYNVLMETGKSLGELNTCPEYMRETFENYLEKLNVYGKMIESLYNGYAMNDVLRIYSANQLFMRQQIVVLDYELTLHGLFDLQYQKVNERLDDSIHTEKSELLSNCRAVLLEDGEARSISFSYLSWEPSIEIDYEIMDTIYPNLYPSLDSVVNLTATSRYSDSDVLIEVEIVGFTQAYRQKISLTEQVTSLLIKPVILTEMPDLSKSKDATLNITVTDQTSGKIVIQENKTIRLMSAFDYILWDDEFGVTTDDNILAWLTPESEGVLKLRREAVDIITELSEGKMTSLASYQNVMGADEADISVNTYLQMVGLQAAISEMGVRYNWGAFSTGSSLNQRVLLPDYVLNSKSGICIETTMLLASAIQSTHMHPMIIFTPGHAQVAVETWKNSGQYFLMETTTLPFDWRTDDWSLFIKYLSTEEWAAYLKKDVEGGLGYVVDCDLLNVLGIQGIGY